MGAKKKPPHRFVGSGTALSGDCATGFAVNRTEFSAQKFSSDSSIWLRRQVSFSAGRPIALHRHFDELHTIGQVVAQVVIATQNDNGHALQPLRDSRYFRLRFFNWNSYFNTVVRMCIWPELRSGSAQRSRRKSPPKRIRTGLERPCARRVGKPYLIRCFRVFPVPIRLRSHLG